MQQEIFDDRVKVAVDIRESKLGWVIHTEIPTHTWKTYLQQTDTIYYYPHPTIKKIIVLLQKYIKQTYDVTLRSRENQCTKCPWFIQ